MEFFIKMMCIGKRPGCQASPEIRYAQVALPLQAFWSKVFGNDLHLNTHYRMKSRHAAGLT